MKTFTYKVEMSCGGCVNAVQKALEKLDGVGKISVDLATKTVTMEAEEKKQEAIEAALGDTGKTWSRP